MQPDAWFVENIQHIYQSGTNLCGQADALALSAAQRCGRACEREVIDADIKHKVEPLADLTYYFVTDGPVSLGQLVLQRVYPCRQMFDVHRRELVDVLVKYLVGQSFLVKPCSMALGAYLRRGELVHPLAHGRRVVFLRCLLDVVGYSVEGGEIVARGVYLVLGDADRVVRAVYQVVYGVLRYVLDRRVEVVAVFVEYCLNLEEDH